MIDQRDKLIEQCKKEIAHAADYAYLKWSRDDLISVHEDDLGDVVFLGRFNPHEMIGDDGNVITQDGKPILIWHHTMWFEDVLDRPILEWDKQQDGKITFKCNMPRLICPAPWLVRIVTPDGQIKGRMPHD